MWQSILDVGYATLLYWLRLEIVNAFTLDWTRVVDILKQGNPAMVQKYGLGNLTSSSYWLGLFFHSHADISELIVGYVVHIKHTK